MKISHLFRAPQNPHVHCGAMFCLDYKVNILHKINDVVSENSYNEKQSDNGTEFAMMIKIEKT